MLHPYTIIIYYLVLDRDIHWCLCGFSLFLSLFLFPALCIHAYTCLLIYAVVPLDICVIYIENEICVCIHIIFTGVLELQILCYIAIN